MLARTHLLRLQRTMYDRMKGHARDFLGTLRPDLRKYFIEYQREFTEFKGVSTKQELLSALQNAHVAMCGDYHTLAQAQRAVMRLLRESLGELRNRGRKVVLALEMIRFRDTPHVTEFLAGRVSEAEFLRSIGYHKNWGFSWENYRQLLEFARENRIPVVGLNADSRNRQASLRERDRFAARVIGSISEQDPRVTVVALMGDLHLAASHLPAALDRELLRRRLERKRLVIHQNHERLYWKLVEKRLEQKADVIKLRDGVFCLMNTPPWVKLQSYLRWVELVSEVGPELPAGSDTFQDVDYADEIRELVSVIRQFLGAPSAVDDDFKVVWPSDSSFLQDLGASSGCSKFSLRVLTKSLTEFESHFIPGQNVVFLKSLSLNQAAAQAAIFLHAKSSGFQSRFESPRRDFYPFIWVEALGFLGSKIINPHRKCADQKDLEAIVKAKSRSAVAKVARIALGHLRAEDGFLRRRRSFRGTPLPVRAPTASTVVLYYLAARRIGQLLGQEIYTAVMQNQVSRDEVRVLFETRFDFESAKSLYLDWRKRLASEAI